MSKKITGTGESVYTPVRREGVVAQIHILDILVGNTATATCQDSVSGNYRRLLSVTPAKMLENGWQ